MAKTKTSCLLPRSLPDGFFEGYLLSNKKQAFFQATPIDPEYQPSPVVPRPQTLPAVADISKFENSFIVDILVSFFTE
jgi:hypothetical protein